jgi:oligoendopeptidase F
LRRYDAEGAAFVPRYLALLEAGGSDTPERLLGAIGLDIADPAFWNGGLDLLEELLEQAEGLATRL